MKAILDVISTIAFIVVCGVLIWSLATGRALFRASSSEQSRSRSGAPQRPAPPPLPSEPVSVAADITKGSGSAKVAVIEYSEFQCPFCGKFFRETWPALNTEYVGPGSVLWVFRHLPLEQLHDRAFRAAEAAQCAASKGQFWAMHDLLFANQKQLDDTTLRGYGSALGMDQAWLVRCMDTEAEPKVRASMSAAHSLGITGTPGFLIGKLGADRRVALTERISGAVSVEEFRKLIGRVLADTSPRTAAR